MPTGPETQALRALTDQLPDKVTDWTSDERSQHADQSNAAMREQSDVSTRQLRSGS